MKICIIADMHLPYIKDTAQYRAFDFTPMIFEIRTPGGAEITMDFIKKERNRLSA